MIGGHLLALWAADRLWGLSMLAYLPPGWTLTYTVTSIGVIALAFSRYLATPAPVLRRLGRQLANTGGLGTLLLCLIAGGFFVVGSTAHHLLGDGYLYLDELAVASGQDQVRGDRAPLLFRLLFELSRVTESLGIGALGTHRLYSWISGIVYVALVPCVARDLASSTRGRALIVGLLLTQGYLQLFFGYVETYPALLPLLLLYLWLGYRALDGGRLAWPLLLMGVLPACHLLTVALWPSLGYLTWRRSPASGGNRNLRVAGALLLVAGLSGCLLWLLGSTPWWSPGDAAARHLLPLRLGVPTVAAYGLLNWEHLFELANALLLAAPVPALLLPSLVGRPGATQPTRFLWLACMAIMGAVGVANPEIGAFRDWDVLALATLPLTLLASRRLQDTGGVTGRAALFVVIAGGLHLVLWVTLNTHVDGSTQRFAALLRAAPLSHHARAYGAGTLARHERDRGRHRASFESYRMAVAAAPDNPRFLRGAGFQAIELEEHDEALRFFIAALQIDSSDVAAWEGTGVARMSRGDHDGGLQALQRAVVLSPRESEYLVNLCQAHNRVGHYQQAIDAEDSAAHYQLALTHFVLGDRALAQRHLQHLRALDPDRARDLEDALRTL